MLMTPNFTQCSLSSYKWPPPTLLTYLDVSLSVEHRPSTTTCQQTRFSLSLFPVVPSKLQCPIASCFCVSPLSHPLGIPLQSLPCDVVGCFPQGVTNPAQNLFTLTGCCSLCCQSYGLGILGCCLRDYWWTIFIAVQYTEQRAYCSHS